MYTPNRLLKGESLSSVKCHVNKVQNYSSMKPAFIRTGSVPVLSPILSGSPKVSLSFQDPITGVFSGEKNTVNSPKISLHLERNRGRDFQGRGIRRAMSESDMIRLENDVSGGFWSLTDAGSRSFPAKIPEEDSLSEGDADDDGSLILKSKGFKSASFSGNLPEIGIPLEELAFSGGGGGAVDEYKNCAFYGGNGDRSKIGAYYQEMLKSNPSDPLLLRNYGKFLHEVEKDAVRAEEYYGRSILASPGDGEVLSLYGTLIWESERDEERARSYFNQAVEASPHDCMVLGSYAHFMWEAEEEEEEEEINNRAAAVEVPPPIISAF